ncbi:hypothetical protein [uncultured Chryseobacterium sp.]|uniref:hypothetical protein n=1 Tax=uncultured Chryseobacterium sp. TaxID=259322 RepID=UPI00262037B2|nr:hypothetical protein [uncultured Chryseobacterium sp.]
MKRIFVLSFLTAGVFSFAQSIGNSPYAAFGIGDVKYDNTVDISAMGGISTAYITDLNNKFNFKNPAANTNLDLTSFSVEGTNENNFYTSDYNNVKSTKHSTYLSNISIAFPISKKLKFGLGYQPYSSKTYNVLSTKVISQTDSISQYNKFVGRGTLNTVQASLGYHFSNNFAIGLRTNYYFGKLYDTEEVTFTNAELVNGFETSNKIQSFNFTAGTTYQKKFENDRKLTLGATYTFGTTGKMTTRYQNSTYYYADSEAHLGENVIDSKVSEEKSLLPQEASLGLGFGHEAKWFASTQVDYKKGETIQFLGQPFQYNNSYKISAGGWVLPNYNNFRSYFSRVIYRFGGYYEKGSLNIYGKDINEVAFTAGATFPFANTNINRMSSIDLGLEVGKRGTTQNNLINQTFFNVKIGLNFADKWFVKRQYD